MKYNRAHGAKAMIGKARRANPEAAVTLGADKGYDAAELVAELRRLKVQPHVAQNTSGRRSAVPDEIAKSDGYSASMQLGCCPEITAT